MKGVITDPIGMIDSTVRDSITQAISRVMFGLDNVDDDVLNEKLATPYGGRDRRHEEEDLLQKMTTMQEGAEKAEKYRETTYDEPRWFVRRAKETFKLGLE